VILPGFNGRDNYFNHDTEVGIIGRGVTIEQCFEDVARVMFSLRTDLSNIHVIEIITFDFEEENAEKALITWLSLLLSKAAEHRLLFGDFRLKREGNQWKATAAGEPWREGMSHGTDLKIQADAALSVKKIDHLWQAECILDIIPSPSIES
jgi:SHS2 domain-containing protein